MGFAVSRTHPGIQDIGERTLAHVRWSDGFAAWGAAYREVALVRSYVDYVTSLLNGWLDDVPDGGSLLVVAHGGIVEALAVGLGSDSELALLGANAGYAEGFAAALHAGRAPLLTAVNR